MHGHGTELQISVLNSCTVSTIQNIINKISNMWYKNNSNIENENTCMHPICR